MDRLLQAQLEDDPALKEAAEWFFEMRSDDVSGERIAEWQQWLSLVIVGAWVAVSPWVLGFSADPTAMRVHLIAGTLVAVGAAVRAWTMSGGMPRMTA